MRIPSLPDWLFYPLMLLVAAALVWIAMQVRPAGTEPQQSGDSLIYEGPALAGFIAGPGTRVAFIPDFPGGPVARLGADASLEAAGTLSAGVGLLIPSEFEAAVIGRRLRVVVEMRATSESLESARLGYFTVSTGDSGWRRAVISQTFERASFEFDVPADARPDTTEWVGVWPDPEGLGREVLVRRVVVEILGEPDGGQ